MKSLSILIVLALNSLWVMPASLLAAETVTPQRPSFSADPSTTSAGTLELEAGYLGSDADGAELPLTLKWGSGERTELFVGWSPWLQVADRIDGTGDVAVGVRHRFLEHDDGLIALAYQVSGKVPTASADDGLGSGVPDLAGAVTASWAFESWTLVGYYQLGLLGRSVASGALVDHGLSLAVGVPLGQQLAGFVEWTGTWRPELRSSDTQWLAGLGYSIRPWLVLDAAGGLMLQPGEDVLWATTGFTINLGRPFSGS